MSFILFDSPSYERAEISTASAYDYPSNTEINIVSEPVTAYSGDSSPGKISAQKASRLSRFSSFGGSWDYSEVD
jgi:hypothetical protein